MKTIKLTLLIVFFLVSASIKSQEIAIGQWRDNLPYGNTIDLAEVGSKIYCATPYSLFSYDKEDNNLKKISKINGLSDAGINKIEYNKEKKMLVVLYSNSNIDLITEDELINIPDIKSASITGGTKVLNNITFYNNYGYIATGFGVVVLDLDKREIKETYFIGQNSTQINVNDIAIGNDTIYAATDNALYVADINAPNLLNFEYWNIDTSINSNGGFDFVKYFNNRLYVNKNCENSNCDSLFMKVNNEWKYFSLSNAGGIYDMKVHNNKLGIAKWGYVGVINSDHVLEKKKWFKEIRPKAILVDVDDSIWIADEKNGLIEYTNEDFYTSRYPNGPTSINNYAMEAMQEMLIVASGGVTEAFHKNYRKDGVFCFQQGKWSNLDVFNELNANDIITIAADPFNKERFFVGSYSNGIIEINKQQIVAQYKKPDYPFDFVSGLKFDESGNLWVLNYQSQLIEFNRNGESKIYELGILTESSYLNVSSLSIDQLGQIWLIAPRDDCMLVFKDGVAKKLTSSLGNGNIPGSDVKCFAFDYDNEVWIGTNEGIGVIYNPGNVFEGDNYDAERIIIEQDGYAQYLLETESINDIKVDGANRKWIATTSSGVYLLSEDGQKEIFHYTKENSPLPSNEIYSIGIQPYTGEVFIGTSGGIVSYRNDATFGEIIQAKEVYAYPNPVKSNYEGPIAVKGLVRDANITITDIAGNLVFRTKALGGQAIWDGKNLNSKKVQSGVYLVFSTNDDGTEKIVTKILFIN